MENVCYGGDMMEVIECKSLGCVEFEIFDYGDELERR